MSTKTAADLTRLIPAHAGKTRLGGLRLRLAWAHPRSRGENELFASCFDEVTGSSPLTRGKPYYEGRQTLQHRLIPAHAGKTKAAQHGICQGWAHPRSRGENDDSDDGFSSHYGSSPLTRGKPDTLRLAASAYGLIPAHAGKTW